ncbi:hypothetical protein ACNHKD_12620 [Methylocystis sp. JAN1]|uniref:hypothetical protein n=1 Tax=Methylocystis sp. JAN1 TaxID=3397211 RepID=UPI003FA2AC0F
MKNKGCRREETLAKGRHEQAGRKENAPGSKRPPLAEAARPRRHKLKTGKIPAVAEFWGALYPPGAFAPPVLGAGLSAFISSASQKGS